ncbi:unnamed protein product [Parnassius apollo]|uniref:(apollo) hypothetical protein n=1 Tax=Parnassius apollo TaxID=110799 RepID=A0A8S3WFP7_PARAO|nr:unnamed protein product [Parnassius apollo]
MEIPSRPDTPQGIDRKFGTLTDSQTLGICVAGHQLSLVVVNGSVCVNSELADLVNYGSDPDDDEDMDEDDDVFGYMQCPRNERIYLDSFMDFDAPMDMPTEPSSSAESISLPLSTPAPFISIYINDMLHTPDVFSSPSGRKFHILKPVSFSHVTKTECKNKPTPQTSKGLSSPSSSSLERFSMYSSRGCSPSLNNISASKLMHGIKIDESEYHDLINLRNDNKKIKKKNEIERKDPKTKLTFTYSFEDSMSQGLTESNENCVFYDEERNKQFEENERQKETLNDEAEREKETENVDVEDVEEREEETGNAEEEDEDAEREEETENTEEEDEEQESGDTGDDESDEYSASEVVSDIDNDVSEEEEDAQDNSVNEWDAVTDLTPELDACTLNESTFNIPIEDISPAGIIQTGWRVMVAVPKEREFKEKDARCFGKMSPDMRAYHVVTEANIGYYFHLRKTPIDDLDRGATNQNADPHELPGHHHGTPTFVLSW